MQMMFFLSSGIFLGWSLGANHASNVFGTAVGTKMIKFRTAAIICSIFVTLGAFFSGSGATQTLEQLGSVNAIAGSFVVAFSTALSITLMTKLGLPVSTSQAIVGAIIGWNFFSGALTDYYTLIKISGTWIVGPALAALFSLVLYFLIKLFFRFVKIHLFRLDAYTRFLLILVGAFGSYALGANNIANVMGVFVPVFPFKPLNLLDTFYITGTQQLFFLGGIAISVGVFTYSYKVIKTVGTSLVSLTPLTAFIVVLSESLVLFLFSSQSLESWLIEKGLPSLPLVPISSTQAVIGAVLGIGIAKGGKNIRWKIMGNIVLGWITTPLLAGIVCYILLFFLQNVFDQQVYRAVPYKITEPMIEKSHEFNLPLNYLTSIKNIDYSNAQEFYDTLKQVDGLSPKDISKIMYLAEIDYFHVISFSKVPYFRSSLLSTAQLEALKNLEGEMYQHKWEFHDALKRQTPEWSFLEDTRKNKSYNRYLRVQLNFVFNTFRILPKP